MLKKSILFIFISLVVFQINGITQNNVTNPNIDLFEHSPSTPNTSQLGKYLDYPVNMSTGVPAIEIPLFTIKTGNITVPIKLKYHAGGLRVNENASWVGMGWSLDAGGQITKRTNGTDDFNTSLSDGNYNSRYISPNYSQYSSYFTAISDAIESPGLATYQYSHPFDVQHFMGRITQGKIDGEADEFMFSTPENSGRFFYNQQLQKFTLDKIDGWKITETPSFSPYDPFIIGNGNWGLLSNNGVQYNFNVIEKAENLIPPVTQLYSANSWYLASINDLANNKSVDFIYDEMTEYTYGGFDISKDIGSAGTGNFYFANPSLSINERHVTEQSISSIEFDQGRIVFVKDTNSRLDGGVNALKEIQILDPYDHIVKKFILTYAYATSDPASKNYTSCPGAVIYYNPNRVLQQLFLQSVQEITYNSNGDLVTKPPYIFKYNFDHAMPCRYSFSQDYWGYYNGKNTNTSLLPQKVFSDLGITTLGPGANRDIDEAYTQIGTIKELDYPTGGKAYFEFENNMTTPGILTGGLRVKKITNYDTTTNSKLVREYTYGNGEQLFAPVNSYSYVHASNPFGGETVNTFIRVKGESIFPLFCSQGSSVLYTDVKEKLVGNSQDLISEHHFINLGKLENLQTASVPQSKYSYYDNFNGQEIANEIYKTNPDGSITIVQAVSKDIEPLNNFKDYFWNVQTAWMFPGYLCFSDGSPLDPYGPGPDQTLLLDVGINAYKMLREQAVVKHNEQTVYDGSKSITTAFDNDFDISNGNQISQQTTNSAGDIILQKTKFATDYAIHPGVWGDQLNSMIEKNLISSPIEITKYIKKKNTSAFLLTEATLFQYQNLQIYKTYKLKISSPISDFQESVNTTSGFKFDSRYELFQEVTYRDSYGNPLTINQNSKKESYIRGYANSNIIAVVKNADQSDIAYSSFEEEGKGNWTYAGTPIVDATSPTGSKCYNLSNGIISKSGLTSGQTYMVTYWSKTGTPFLIKGSILATRKGSTINGWTYFEHEISASTIIVSGSGNIDELRLYPKGSIITTYTQSPLVGITSSCDVNNHITRYEYDLFNRLSIIRDQDNNILKKICYNYAGQVEGCPVGTNNSSQWRATGNTRCQPCPSNNSYNSGVKEKEESDVNPSSATYNSIRWVSDPTSSCPSPADWQVTSSTCETSLIAPHQFTGNQIIIKTDENPCSTTYGQTQTSTVLNTAVCKVCNPACTGPGNKCINGVCTAGNLIIIKATRNSDRFHWTCYYAYCFPDGTVSDIVQTTTTTTACTIGSCSTILHH
ncbi:MAG: hypothetical protein JSU03_01760 [Bacteroidetes bacterium]|nr:hypothetical protein [Bacteroidota bacterium]